MCTLRFRQNTRYMCVLTRTLVPVGDLGGSVDRTYVCTRYCSGTTYNCTGTVCCMTGKIHNY